MRLYLIRHCETQLNDERRFQGWTNERLSQAGLSRALRLGRSLAGADWPPSTIWSSDLIRARETAEFVAGGRPVRLDPRLREINFGIYEGKRYEELLSEHGTRLSAWLDDPLNGPTPPGGESLSVFLARVRGWLEEVGTGKPVTAVTHLGPVWAMLAELCQVDFREMRGLAVAPGEVLHVTTAGVQDVPTVLRLSPGATWIEVSDARLVQCNDPKESTNGEE